MGINSRQSIEVRTHNGKVVGVNVKGDPLAKAQYLVSIAQGSNDPNFLETANDVLVQMTTLLKRQADISLPGDLDLLEAYKKLRGDYLMLKNAFRDMSTSNETYRATVVEMGSAMSAKGMPTPVEYMRAISENTALPNATSTDADWPDSDITGDNAKR